MQTRRCSCVCSLCCKVLSWMQLSFSKEAGRYCLCGNDPCGGVGLSESGLPHPWIVWCILCPFSIILYSASLESGRHFLTNQGITKRILKDQKNYWGQCWFWSPGTLMSLVPLSSWAKGVSAGIWPFWAAMGTPCQSTALKYQSLGLQKILLTSQKSETGCLSWSDPAYSGTAGKKSKSF